MYFLSHQYTELCEPLCFQGQLVYQSHDPLSPETRTPTPTGSSLTVTFPSASRRTHKIQTKQYNEPRHPQGFEGKGKVVFFSVCPQLVLTYLAFSLHFYFSSVVTEVTEQMKANVDHDQAFVW